MPLASAYEEEAVSMAGEHSNKHSVQAPSQSRVTARKNRFIG